MTVVDEPRLSAWEARMDWPLTSAALLFLVAYAVSVLVPGITGVGRFALDVVLWGVWAVFAVDYVARFWLAENRWRFVRRHPVDLILVILPMFRQLRALRVFTVLMSLDRQLRDDVRGRVTVYITGATGLIVFVGALAVLDAERADPEASINSFGEALWWTVTTITTVGYGDRYPVTTEGRFVAGALMLSGIALLGTVTATIASWFVERIRVVNERTSEQTRIESAADERATRAEIAEVLDELRALHSRIDALRARE